MKKNRCYLCNGKLKSGICTECGLDNRNSDNRYYLSEKGSWQRNKTRDTTQKLSEITLKESTQKKQGEEGYYHHQAPIQTSSYNKHKNSKSVDTRDKRGQYIVTVITIVIAIIGAAVNIFKVSRDYEYANYETYSEPTESTEYEYIVELEPESYNVGSELEAGIYDSYTLGESSTVIITRGEAYANEFQMDAKQVEQEVYDMGYDIMQGDLIYCLDLYDGDILEVTGESISLNKWN